VYPLSNLIVTQQVKSGDVVWVDFNPELDSLQFWKDASWTPTSMVAQWASQAMRPAERAAPSNASAEPARWLRVRNVKP